MKRMSTDQIVILRTALQATDKPRWDWWIRATMSITVALGLTHCQKPHYELESLSERWSVSSTGNGSPSGSHYNLNIIGTRDKSADMNGNMGHRIFVPLEGSTKILLTEGEFQVLDANGTDGSAKFQLPNPDPDNDGVTSYSVWARALGKPGGSSKTTTCAVDPVSGELFCSIYSMVLVRESGGSKFSNVSKQLLYVYADLDGDGVVERMPLFDERLKDYFWQYDNKGLRLAQLRFYPIATNVD